MSDSQVNAVSPAHAPGTVHVTVTTASGTSAATGLDNFTFAPLPGCVTAAVTSNPTSPQAIGAIITFTATSTGCLNPLYEFWIEYPNLTWHLVQSFDGATWKWNTALYAAGTYVIHAWANQTGDSQATWEAYGTLTFTLTPAPVGPNCATATVSPTSPNQQAGSTVAFTAGSTGSCPNPMFEWWIQVGANWYMVSGFSTDTHWNFDSTGYKPGTYTVHVWANQLGHQSAAWEAYASSTVTLTGCTSATITPSSGTVPVGTPVAFTATAVCSPVDFEFWIQTTAGKWYLVQPFSPSPNWNWGNAGYPKGVFHIHVWANTHGAYQGSYQVFAEAVFTLN